MPVVAYDKFVSAERFRELGVEGVDDLDEFYARADFITLHLPKTSETINVIDADSIEKMREGRPDCELRPGELIDLDALVEGLRVGQGGRRGARRLPRGAIHRAPDPRARGRGR
jgi:D-3-phosphoglycerate dehydrogenase